MIAFDRVVIGLGTRREIFSVEQFLGLPFDARIKLILARDIAFFKGDARVERTDALRSLRHQVPVR